MMQLVEFAMGWCLVSASSVMTADIVNLHGGSRTKSLHHQRIINSALDVGNIPESEMNGLRALYNATDGPNWRYRNSSFGYIPWNFTPTANPCEDKWEGLVCTTLGTVPSQYYSIIEIDLGLHNLRGTIPDEIGDFPNLYSLDLVENHINGTIPSQIGSLTNLLQLELVANNLTGSLPASLANLNRLNYIDASFNLLNGTLPDSLASMTTLETLVLSYNLFSGSLPEYLTTFPQLFSLYFYGNRMTGTIPASIGNLSNLHYLDLGSNLLHGTLPDELGELRLLQFISLHSNTQISGTIPAALQHLQNALFLWLYNTSLTGTIPASLGSLSSMQYLRLQDNQLTGTIPPALGNMSSVKFVDMSNNLLSGTIPPSLSSLAQIEFLLLEANKLVGTLKNVFRPDVQVRLSTVQLSKNQLTGTIPQELFMLPNLGTLVTVSNCFVGTIPEPVACNATRLSTLSMDGQRTGTSCRNVMFPGISSAYAPNRRFTGSLPACLFQLPRLSTLHLSGNDLTGTLPSDLSIAPNLVDLSLSHNRLSGRIPNVIQERDWYNLDLSYNRLNGLMSPSFEETPVNFTFALAYENLLINYTEGKNTKALKLQNNRLSGEVADSVLGIRNISILRGNLFNCHLDRDNLPEHDAERFKYICGSASFDGPYVTWLILVSIIVISTLVTWKVKSSVPVQESEEQQLEEEHRGTEKQNIRQLIKLWKKWLNVVHQTEDPSLLMLDRLTHPSYVVRVYNALCQVTMLCMLYTVVILLPIYAAMSAYYGTHTYQYAYVLSATFQSGAVPFILDFLALGMFVLFTALCFRYFLKQVHATQQNVVSLTRSISNSSESDRSNDDDGVNNNNNNNNARSSSSKNRCEDGDGEFSGTRLTSSKMMMTFEAKNRLYNHKKSSNPAIRPGRHRIINFSKFQRIAICAAFFLLNALVVFSVNVGFVYVALYESSSLLVIAQILLSFFKFLWNVTCSPYIIRWTSHFLSGAEDVDVVYKRAGFFALQLFVSLFNNIGIPCLVVIVIDPNCLYNVWIDASTDTSHYLYANCRIYGPKGCVLAIPAVGTTSYNPPFSYSYQCSSSFVTYYAPTFVYLCLLRIFVSPCSQILTAKLLEYFPRDSAASGFLRRLAPRILKPITWKAEENIRRNVLHPYFDANQVLINIFTLLGIMFTFGAVFPPLAVCLAVTIVSVTYFEKLKLGRFITNVVEAQLHSYLDILRDECKGVGSVRKLSRALWVLVCISCVFYAPFLFDTLGNACGFSCAYWVLIVVPLAPLLLLALHSTGIYWMRKRKLQQAAFRKDEEQGGGSGGGGDDDDDGGGSGGVMLASIHSPLPLPAATHTPTNDIKINNNDDTRKGVNRSSVEHGPDS